MTREELEHIIRASGDITDQYEFIIVGSQSILGPVPRPEDVFTVSMEADIYPLQAPELADRIDGAIGEGSQFHETFGYYAQGVGPETACLPADWMQRCTAFKTAIPKIASATAWMCLTCSWPRPWRHGRRIVSSASRCCSMATWSWTLLWYSCGTCLWMPRSSRPCGQRYGGGPKVWRECSVCDLRRVSR